MRHYFGHTLSKRNQERIAHHRVIVKDDLDRLFTDQRARIHAKFRQSDRKIRQSRQVVTAEVARTDLAVADGLVDDFGGQYVMVEHRGQG